MAFSIQHSAVGIQHSGVRWGRTRDYRDWGLEERFGIEHGTLQRLNPQLDPRRLAVGSTIVIKGESVPAANTNETYYTIRSGDTFWGLENAWGIAHGTLQRLNPTLEPRSLQIGQRIRRS